MRQTQLFFSVLKYTGLVAYAQLDVIVALTRDDGKSMASRALRTPLAKWLGKVSMSVYLIHIPLQQYLCWAVYGGGRLFLPAEMDCSKFAQGSTDREICEDNMTAYNDAKTTPIWGIPVVFFAGIILGSLIHYFVEEPARRLLRARL